MKSERAKKRAEKWKMAGEIKTHRGCVDCGYNTHAVALQFDHINDDKKASVSNLIRSDYAWATILEEIDKCEVRCANCHAVVTARRKLSYHESVESTVRFDSLGQQGLHEEEHSLLSIPLSSDEPPLILGEVPALSSAWFQRLFGKIR